MSIYVHRFRATWFIVALPGNGPLSNIPKRALGFAARKCSARRLMKKLLVVSISVERGRCLNYNGVRARLPLF